MYDFIFIYKFYKQNYFFLNYKAKLIATENQSEKVLPEHIQ